MPHRRPRKTGSFASHFDELVVHFPVEGESARSTQPQRRSEELQGKIDIHRQLFEQAWRMDGER